MDRPRLTRRVKAGIVTILLLAAIGGTLWWSVRVFGILDTVIYVFLFLGTFTFIPLTIYMGLPAMSSGIGSFYGKLHFIYGQFAYGHGYLVQRADRWELCPGTTDSVYIDGEWRDIDGGRENLTVLGWQPFGILNHKTDTSLSDERVDPANEVLTKTDGGVETITQGGVRQREPDLDITGMEGTWLVDLKRVYSKGLETVGGIDILESAEQVAKEKESTSGRTAGKEHLIGMIVGLLIGLATGYAAFGGF